MSRQHRPIIIYCPSGIDESCLCIRNFASRNAAAIRSPECDISVRLSFDGGHRVEATTNYYLPCPSGIDKSCLRVRNFVLLGCDSHHPAGMRQLHKWFDSSCHGKPCREARQSSTPKESDNLMLRSVHTVVRNTCRCGLPHRCLQRQPMWITTPVSLIDA